MTLVKAEQPQGDQCQHIWTARDPRVAILKPTVWTEGEDDFKWEEMRARCKRGETRMPDRAPVRAQTYWHRSAPSALRLSWPPGLWAHLQIAVEFLRRSESLSLRHRVRWERSSCDWKLIREISSHHLAWKPTSFTEFFIFTRLIYIRLQPQKECLCEVGGLLQWCCVETFTLLLDDAGRPWLHFFSFFFCEPLSTIHSSSSSVCCQQIVPLSVWEDADLYAIYCARRP